MLIIVVWGVSGPAFGYSDTWQLVINTGTTIITFLMVFLIQNTQNRDAKAIHLKLDELLRAQKTCAQQSRQSGGDARRGVGRLQKEFEKVCKTRGIGEHAIEVIEDEMEERGMDEEE